MSQIKIVINNPSSTADNIFRLRPYSGDKHVVCQRLVRLMDAMNTDQQGTSMTMYIDGRDGVKASGTLTGTAVVATNTAQVGSQVFTASATPSGNNQFLVGGSDAATMANLAAKISAHPSLSPIVSASAVSNVVTITASSVGVGANSIQLVGSADIVASGSGYLVGGVEPTLNQYNFAGLL